MAALVSLNYYSTKEIIMPRNDALNQKMRDERQQVVLSSALKLFAVNGYSATKISDIAKQAKISQGSLYHYYKSKEHIFVALVGSAFKKMNQAAKMLEELPLSPKEKIEMALNRMVTQMEEGEAFSNNFMLIAQATVSEATPDKAKKIIKEEQHIPYDVISNIMKAGQSEGTVVDSDPNELALLFWITVKGLALHKSAFGENFKAPSLELLTSPFLKK